MKNKRFFSPRMRFTVWRLRRRNARAMRAQGQYKQHSTQPRSSPQWTNRQRGLFYFFALGACAVAVVAAGIISYLLQAHEADNFRIFELLDAQGNPFIPQELILLDPYHRSEITLRPGETAQRPIAWVNTGDRPMLVRVRVEETVLARRRNIDGELITTARARNQPSDTHTPHTITREQAHAMLVQAEFVSPNTTWEQIMASRVSAQRLPGGDNAGGRLLVLEQIHIDHDALDPTLPDLSALRPEDLYALGLGITLHEFMGFYLLPQGDGDFLFQPLVLRTQDNRDQNTAPTIAQILYEYVQWGVVQRGVHHFGQRDNLMQLQGSAAMRPLTDFTTPEDAWFFDNDGWVYYGMALAPGVMTPVLITSYALHHTQDDELRYHIELVMQPVPPQYAITTWSDGEVLNFDVNATTARARRMIREINA